jgi:Hemerythrin HHE cation binding domain
MTSATTGHLDLTVMVAFHDAFRRDLAHLDPLVAAVDRAFNDRDGGHQRLGDTVDALASELHGHLRHEERDALPLLDRTLTPAEWQAFGNDQRRSLGFGGAAQLFPWLLQEASPQQVKAVLAGLPPPLREEVLRRHTATSRSS